MSRLDPLLNRYLVTLEEAGLSRTLRPFQPLGDGLIGSGERHLLDFSSNDYLGLARHPALIERARAWAASGTGARASRLVTGTTDRVLALERRLAALKGTEAALILGSGWQANASLLPALLDRALLGAEPALFADRLIHASLHQGCAAAGIRAQRYRHNDLAHLEMLLSRAPPAQPKFIVTESVFSMDGDRADLAGLADLADRYDAVLFVDEAHATGLFGPGGGGLSTLLPGRIDIVMGTFSKALGGYGAYVAGSGALCAYLANRASGFVYATALPPAVLGAADAALDLLPGLEAARQHLQHLAQTLRAMLAERGIETAGSSTQIVPAVIGDARAAIRLSRALEAEGMLAVAIRPPTVPPGSARLRFALSAMHEEADIGRLVAALDRCWPAADRAT